MDDNRELDKFGLLILSSPAPLERGLSKSKTVAMAAKAATFWLRKGKTAIFGKSEQPWQATLPKLPRNMDSENLPFFPATTTTHILMTTLQHNNRLHSRPPTTSFLSTTPRQTPTQD
jgi:hypothetical protein